MQGKQRKVVQAVSYELLALAFVAPLATWVFGSSLLQSGLVALATSLVAMTWNMLFNARFEAWEARQRRPQRTFARRVLHALGIRRLIVSNASGGLFSITNPDHPWSRTVAAVAERLGR